jgi:hypothetical protein
VALDVTNKGRGDGEDMKCIKAFYSCERIISPVAASEQVAL